VSISNRLGVSARYSIVSGDPGADRLELLAIAARNRGGPPERFERRYAKYYEHNPLGAPSVFFARDNRSEKLVGMTALFPTALRVAGQLLPAAIGGDFAVDAEHRGFGPAVALQRATTAVLCERDFSCAYGSPNRFSEPIIGRAGYADVGRFTVFVKLLRARPLVDRYTRRARLAGLASAAADPVLSVVSRERLYRRSARFSVDQPEIFDDRFANLWEIARDPQGATSERNADLLNWKYEKTGPAAAPGGYSVFALLEGNDVAGYIVYRLDHDSRLVYDIVHLPEREVIDALLAEFILDARHSQAAVLDLGYVGPGNLLSQRLRAFGFLQRTGKTGLRVYVNGDAPFGVNLLNRDNWYFLTGDTDL
jgi:GNAT superfamily N-acetyltransferase